jgi:hypothetical protein
MFLCLVFILTVLLIQAAAQTATAASPSDTQPLGDTQTLIYAGPNATVVRVNHRTTDMVPEVQCPTGYKVIGGGFKGSVNALVYHSYKKNNGWQIKAKPFSTTWPHLTVYATCIQWSHPITYHKQSIAINSLQTDGTAAACDAGQVALGGGYKMNDSRALIYSSIPGTNNWNVIARNQAAISKTLTVSVICGPAAFATQSIVSDVINVPPGTTQSNIQKCPTTDYSVTSGGFDATLIYWRISSYPKNGDVWRVTMRNDHTSDTIAFAAYANCFEFP